MSNFISGADFDTDSDSDSFVTRESNGIASLSMTLTGKVNSLVRV